MTNKGTYIGFDGKSINFEYENALSLSQKASFVMEYASMIVSRDIGYAYILKPAIFKYCLIKYFTDITIFDDENNFSLDMIDRFVNANNESVIEVVRKAIGDDAYQELCTACDEAVDFRKAHFSDYRDEISDLLQVVREFVVKPDYMNELLAAATKALDKFAEKDDIDMGTVNKLADVVHIVKDMGSNEVAKAIVREFHQNTKDEKKDTKNDLEIVK